MRLFAWSFYTSLLLALVNFEVSSAGKADERKSVAIDQGFQCAGCEYFTAELLKRLNTRRSEADILDQVDGICHYDMLNKHRGPLRMDKFKLACDAILRNWEDELIEELRKQPVTINFKKYFCTEFTRLCEGVNLHEFINQQSEQGSFTPEHYQEMINKEPLERPPNSDL